MGERSGAQAGRWILIFMRLASSPGGMTVAELAREMNCTPRTIYRDLKAMEGWLGAPLTTDKDENDTRWKLMEGNRFRLPLAFTPAELLSLATAERFLDPLNATSFAQALKTLKSKVKARLGDETVKSVTREADAFQVASRVDYTEHASTIETLRRAIRELRTVEMRYFSAGSGRETVRRVDPYRLWFAEGALYVVGACHVHGGRPRTFAVERIRAIETTDERYLIPASFRWEDWTRDSFRVFQGEPTRVVIHFSEAVAPLIRSRKWHPTQQLSELPGGGVGLFMRVAGTFEVSRWILSFGAHAQAVEPTELVREIRAEVERMHQTLVRGSRRVAERMAARAGRK